MSANPLAATVARLQALHAQATPEPECQCGRDSNGLRYSIHCNKHDGKQEPFVITGDTLARLVQLQAALPLTSSQLDEWDGLQSKHGADLLRLSALGLAVQGMRARIENFLHMHMTEGGASYTFDLMTASKLQRDLLTLLPAGEDGDVN